MGATVRVRTPCYARLTLLHNSRTEEVDQSLKIVSYLQAELRLTDVGESLRVEVDQMFLQSSCQNFQLASR